MKSQVLETRARVFEVRENEDGRSIQGLLVKYDEPAKVGNFKEQFRSGAFKPIGDVIANLQHDRSKPLARNSAGGGLELIDDPDALRVRIDLPETTIGRDTQELVKRGILRGLSIEFRVLEQRASSGIREILKARLTGLGIVDRPAYPQSIITKRDLKIFQGDDMDQGATLLPYV